MWYFQRSRTLLTLGLILGCSVMLSGCGELNSQFTCPMKPGVNCQSLDQVNTLVDQGKLAEAKPTPILAHSADPVLTVNMSYSADNNGVTRSPEQVMRLWVAPYQDNKGNYFSSTQIYHVIQPGHWSTDPIIEDNTHA
jgi:conjugal transfer pilus assembly protein TraV